MKKITTAAVILFATACLFSCSKSSPGTPVNNQNGTGGNNNSSGSNSPGNNNGNNTNTPGTTLAIGVVDINGNIVSGGTVYLFSSKSDWDNFVYNGINNSIATATSGANGVVTFTGVTGGLQYYWVSVLNCENSVPDSVNETGILSARVQNTGGSVLQGTETITVLNKNSSFAMNVYLNNVFVQKVLAGSGVNLRYIAIGFQNTIKCVDAVDAASQTQTFTLTNCGGTQTLNFNP